MHDILNSPHGAYCVLCGLSELVIRRQRNPQCAAVGEPTRYGQVVPRKRTEELGHAEIDIQTGRCRACGVRKVKILTGNVACLGHKHPVLGVTLAGDDQEDEAYLQEAAEAYAGMFGTPENLGFALRQRMKGMAIGKHCGSPMEVWNVREDGRPLLTTQLTYYPHPSREVADGSPDRPEHDSGSRLARASDE